MSEALPMRASSDRGQSLVETALLVPLLLVILLGAFEAARAAVTASVLQNAVLAGAQYGGAAPANSTDQAAIATVVRTETRVPQASSTNPMVASDVAADTDGERVVRVSATFTLTGLVPYPGLPAQHVITRRAEWRVRR